MVLKPATCQNIHSSPCFPTSLLCKYNICQFSLWAKKLQYLFYMLGRSQHKKSQIAVQWFDGCVASNDHGHHCRHHGFVKLFLVTKERQQFSWTSTSTMSQEWHSIESNGNQYFPSCIIHSWFHHIRNTEGTTNAEIFICGCWSPDWQYPKKPFDCILHFQDQRWHQTEKRCKRKRTKKTSWNKGSRSSEEGKN